MSSRENKNPVSEEHKEIIAELVGFDFNKLKRTFKDMTLRPGPAINAYVAGDRSSYLSPITYYFLTFGLFFLISSATGSADFLLSWVFANNFPDSKFIEFFQSFFASKEKQSLVVPLGILSQWMIFRRYRKSFIHNGYYFLYSSAQSFLFHTLLILFFLISKSFYAEFTWTFGIYLDLALTIYCGVGFYSMSLGKLAWKSLLVHLFFSLITGVLISIFLLTQGKI